MSDGLASWLCLLYPRQSRLYQNVAPSQPDLWPTGLPLVMRHLRFSVLHQAPFLVQWRQLWMEEASHTGQACHHRCL